MALAEIVKDPGATRDYQIDWTQDLASGDTIATATWTVDAGVTKVSESNSTTVATVRVSGGTAGTRYTLKCTATMASGQIDVRRLILVVQEL
jgi:hypothetical protein